VDPAGSCGERRAVGRVAGDDHDRLRTRPGAGSEQFVDLVDSLPGRLSQPLQDVARELGIYLVFGTYERGAERGTVYNSAALLGPNGALLGVYRKTHLFPPNGGTGEAGRRQAVSRWSSRRLSGHRPDDLL